jgi:hypothetical protein
MLPEPTPASPPKRAAAPARPQLGIMTPLFSVPGGTESEAMPGAGRRVRSTGRNRRSSARLPAPRADPASVDHARVDHPRAGQDGGAGRSGPLKDPADLLAVTAERLRRALARSFLRYGVAGDLEAAIHAAMNVVEPVLEARDTEILRLRRLMAGKAPVQTSAKVPAPSRRRASAKVSGELSG